MGILELNEDGGGGGGRKEFVTERFLVGEAGRDKDEDVGGISEDVDGDVDTGEEDNKKRDLVGEFVVELDCLVEPWPLLGFRLIGSGTVIARLPLNSRRRPLLLPFSIEVEDTIDELEPRVAPATKAALPWARLHFSAMLQAASTARSTMG